MCFPYCCAWGFEHLCVFKWLWKEQTNTLRFSPCFIFPLSILVVYLLALFSLPWMFLLSFAEFSLLASFIFWVCLIPVKLPVRVCHSPFLLSVSLIPPPPVFLASHVLPPLKATQACSATAEPRVDWKWQEPDLQLVREQRDQSLVSSKLLWRQAAWAQQ